MDQPITTGEVLPAERLARRCDSVPGHFARFGSECDGIPTDQFSVRLTKKTACPAEILEIEAAGRAVHRLRPRLQHPGLYVVLQIKGESQPPPGGGTEALKPNDFILFDASRATEARFDGPGVQAVIFIPLAAAPPDPSHPMRTVGRRFDGAEGVGAMASGFLATFVKHAPLLPAPQVQMLLRVLADILSTASLSLEDKEAAQSSSRQQAFHRRRILQYLSENLRDPNLTPTTIAAVNGISRRYLGKLFEGRGVPITRYVWDQRLERCRRELEDPRSAHKQITEIAFSWGFSSASHFSRKFRDRFGMSPTQARLNTGD